MSTGAGSIRRPVVAGMFYPDDPEECLRMVQDMFRCDSEPGGGKWLGAVLPHAGWICSGRVAAEGIAALKAANPSPDVVIIFGAVHTVGGIGYGALDEHESWSVPTGLARIAQDLQAKLAAYTTWVKPDSRVHRREHSIEVEVPLLQHAWPGVPLLPIGVPPIREAVRIGREVAQVTRAQRLKTVFIASSDLTHYGPNYGVMPLGAGADALQWAAENDRRLLDKISQLKADEIVAETEENQNACGGGAIAALIGACLEMGASKAQLIRHTNSYQVLSTSVGRQRLDNFVGYAAMVIG